MLKMRVVPNWGAGAGSTKERSQDRVQKDGGCHAGRAMQPGGLMGVEENYGKEAGAEA